MELWVGVIGVLAGVVVGGAFTLVAGRLQSQDSNRRQKLQFERDDQIALRSATLAVHLETLTGVQAFIDIASDALPQLARQSQSAKWVDLGEPLVSALNKAFIAMDVLGEPLDNVNSVRNALAALSEAEHISGKANTLSHALANLQRQHNEIKKVLIQASI